MHETFVISFRKKKKKQTRKKCVCMMVQHVARFVRLNGYLCECVLLHGVQCFPLCLGFLGIYLFEWCNTIKHMLPLLLPIVVTRTRTTATTFANNKQLHTDNGIIIKSKILCFIMTDTQQTGRLAGCLWHHTKPGHCQEATQQTKKTSFPSLFLFSFGLVAQVN